jgi:hypothetical protein
VAVLLLLPLLLSIMVDLPRVDLDVLFNMILRDKGNDRDENGRSVPDGFRLA